MDGELEGGEEDVFSGYFLSELLRINFNYWFFPGLIMHELAHYVACVLAGSRVYKTVFWSPRGGYVIHKRVRGSSSIVISLFPFFFNNFLAALLLVDSFSNSDAIMGLLELWLAFSLAIYSIPSIPDMQNSVDALNRSYRAKRKAGGMAGLLALLSYPLFFVIHYLFLLPLLFFTRHRTLRILWFFVLYAALESGIINF